MSSRHLRRVLEEQQKSAEVHDECGIEEDQPVRAKASAFGLLLEDEESSTEDEVDELLSPSDLTNSEERLVSQTSDNTISMSKRNNYRNQAQHENSGLSDIEFEEALKQLATSSQAVAQTDAQQGVQVQFFQLLQPDSALLDPMLELKRKIGNFSVASGVADQRFAGLIQRVDVRAKKGVSSVSRTRKGRMQLVVPQASWPAVPAAAIGLELQRNEDVDDGPSFVLSHSRTYLNDLATAVYMMRIGDIDGLVAFIHHGHAYQIDALLVISDYVRMSSVSEAGELVEWAIHLMERCFTGCGFNPFAPVGRGSLLPYSTAAENRKLHLALFRHIQYLLKRGCNRTALEFCKLMLCLDMEDPLLVSPLMAQAALGAGEYGWVLEFGRELAKWRPYQYDWNLAMAISHVMIDERDEADVLMTCLLVDCPAVRELLSSDVTSDCVSDVHEKALIKILIQRIASALKEGKIATWLQQCLSRTQPAAKTSSHFPWSDIFEHARIYRHSMLSDLPALNMPMPASIASRDLHVYDPIPPEQLGRQSVVSSLADNLSRILGRFF